MEKFLPFIDCRSAKDDLGEHVLYKDDNYRISFCPNVFIELYTSILFIRSGQVHRFTYMMESGIDAMIVTGG